MAFWDQFIADFLLGAMFAADESGIIDAIAIFVQKEVHPLIHALHALMPSFEPIVHAIAILVDKAFDRLAAFFEYMSVTVAFQTMRAIVLTGDIVDPVAVEIDDIVDESVFVSVDETSIEIVDPIAVCIYEMIVAAVQVCVDKGKVVWIGCESEVVDPIAVCVEKAIIEAVAVLVDIADDSGVVCRILAGLSPCGLDPEIDYEE